MKIRHYKIEDRQSLGQVDSPDWNKHFKKYLQDLECPFVDSPLPDQLEWLLQYAIKLEYSDNSESIYILTTDRYSSMNILRTLEKYSAYITYISFFVFS